MAYYIDTSALVKLVVHEPQTPALRHWIAQTSRVLVGCDLVRTELQRAVRRIAPDRATQARAVLDSLTILAVPTEIFEAAGRLDPLLLRSLDAVHLAGALDLGDDLEGLVTYDDRLADASLALGITVLAPT